MYKNAPYQMRLLNTATADHISSLSDYLDQNRTLKSDLADTVDLQESLLRLAEADKRRNQGYERSAAEAPPLA